MRVNEASDIKLFLTIYKSAGGNKIKITKLKQASETKQREREEEDDRGGIDGMKTKLLEGIDE